MKSYIDSIKRHIDGPLEKSAREYLQTGLTVFHKNSKTVAHPTQMGVAIGNLSIGIELLLKSFIAKKNPLLIFEGLPLPLRALQATANLVPQDSISRFIDLELRSFGYKTIDIDECISLFYIYHPTQKSDFQSYFRLLSKMRNLSVHAAIPIHLNFELEKIAYLSIKLVAHLKESELTCKNIYYLDVKDLNYLKSYDHKRIERVTKKIDTAKKKAASNDGDVSLSLDGWDLFVIECPVCKSDAVLYGYTEYDIQGTGPDDYDEFLTFNADSFKCDECGLALDDTDELRLVGLEISYDRHEFDKWHAENDPTDDFA